MSRLKVIILAACLALVASYFWFKFDKSNGTEGLAMVEVTIPALTGAALQGETAFNEICSSCHGKNAAGKSGVAPPLIHKIYEPSHHGDMAFVLAAKQGVRAHHWQFGNMPPVPDVSDQQITDIITYVRTLQRANGIN